MHHVLLIPLRCYCCGFIMSCHLLSISISFSLIIRFALWNSWSFLFSLLFVPLGFHSACYCYRSLPTTIQKDLFYLITLALGEICSLPWVRKWWLLYQTHVDSIGLWFFCCFMFNLFPFTKQVIKMYTYKTAFTGPWIPSR